MGTYVNWDDVVARWPSTSKISDSEEMSESYIVGVEAVMNAHLAKVFTVPVIGEPPLLKDIATDLVYAKIAVNKDKAWAKVKQAAMMLLKQIIDSDVLLVDSIGEVIASTGQAVWSSTEDYFDSFSMLGTPEDLIDPDHLRDLSDERC